MRFRAFSPTSLDITWLALLLVLGLSLRGPGLAEKCLWSDEMVAIGYNAGALLPDLMKVLAEDIHPPLFYLLQRFSFDLFGIHPISIRLIPFLCGLAAPLLLFLVVRRRAGFRAALASSLFLVLSPIFINWSQTGRMYAVLVLAAVFLLEASLRLDEGQPGSRTRFIAALTIGTLLDWPFLLLVPPLLIASALKRDSAAFRRLLAVIAVSLLLVAPVALASLASRLGDGPAGRKFLQTEMSPVSPTALFDTLNDFTVSTDLFLVRLACLPLLLPLFLSLARDEKETRLAGLAWWMTIVPPVTLYLISLLLVTVGASPVYVDRALLYCLAPLAVWIGFLLSRLRSLKGFLLVSFALSLVLVYQHLIRNIQYMDRGWRSDAAFLKKHGKQGDLLYLAPWFSAEEYVFYREGPVRFLSFRAEDFAIHSYLDVFRQGRVTRQEIESMLEASLQSQPRVWYLEKDLECALGDGHRFDHDSFVHDWLRRHYRRAAHHVSAFPNGRGRHDLYLYSRQPAPEARERSLSVQIDAGQMPSLRILSMQARVELSFDGRKLNIPPGDFDYASTTRLHHFRFLSEATCELVLSRLHLDPEQPLPAHPWLAILLKRLRSAGRVLAGQDIFDLGPGTPVSGQGDDPIVRVHLAPAMASDPLLRCFIFCLGAPIPFVLIFLLLRQYVSHQGRRKMTGGVVSPRSSAR